MFKYEETLWCAGCGVEITWQPVIDAGDTYCCEDCEAGLDCECKSLQEQDDERRSAEVPNIY